MEKRLEDFKSNLLKELKRDYRPEYRDSVTLSIALDQPFYGSLELLENAIAKADYDELKALKKDFLNKAKDYAQEWYDDDLECYRAGYEWESNYYRQLAEIIEA